MTFALGQLRIVAYITRVIKSIIFAFFTILVIHQIASLYLLYDDMARLNLISERKE